MWHRAGSPWLNHDTLCASISHLLPMVTPEAGLCEGSGACCRTACACSAWIPAVPHSQHGSCQFTALPWPCSLPRVCESGPRFPLQCYWQYFTFGCTLVHLRCFLCCPAWLLGHSAYPHGKTCMASAQGQSGVGLAFREMSLGIEECCLIIVIWQQWGHR